MMKLLGYFSKLYILMTKSITNIYGQGNNDCRKITAAREQQSYPELCYPDKKQSELQAARADSKIFSMKYLFPCLSYNKYSQIPLRGIQE